jgi:hypothetical protein
VKLVELSGSKKGIFVVMQLGQNHFLPNPSPFSHLFVFLAFDAVKHVQLKTSQNNLKEDKIS